MDEQTRFMQRAIDLSVENVRLGLGGPFGAVLVKDGTIIAEGTNLVTSSNDPTAHAEVTTIRRACAALGSFQLDGCDLYTSCEPCPMCLGAIYWARPSRIFFGGTHKDAADFGFDDSFIFQQTRLPVDQRHIPMKQLLGQEAIAGFLEWQKSVGKILYEDMDRVLELRNISKHYPGHHAVNGISFSVDRGAFFALLGPSGCGKTTTLRLIAGFEEATAGDIFLNDQRINQLKPYQRNVNTVFQNYALFPHLTVRGNIEFGLRRNGSDGIANKVRDVLDLVQLSGKEDRLPAQLSGGERQRVALARSLVLRPEVLLLDEPLSALDPNLRKQVRGELKDLQRRTGITFLFVTHDQEEALSMSDQIAVMHNGLLEQVGTPQDIYLRPSSRFVAGFLGSVNWIEGIGVRPEATRISRTPPAPGTRSIGAVVHHSLFLGNCLRVEATSANGQRMVAEISRLDGAFEAGEAVQMWWNPTDELPI